MPSDDISNCTCKAQAWETDLVSMIRETCNPYPDEQGLLNAGRENGLHGSGLPFTEQIVNDGNHSIIVYIENGTDIVVGKSCSSGDTSATGVDEKTGETKGSLLYGPKTSMEVSNVIVSILERYRMAPKEDVPAPWEAENKISSLVREYIELGEVIPMVLPAFPFKSPNKKFKVLSHLPDKGEEVALAHLNGLCKLIESEYTRGARIDIVSDGLMYNGISDKEVWAYGQAVRKLAVDTGCSNINFVRLVHLLGEVEMGEPLSEKQYLKDASWFRTQLYERNIPDNFDVSKLISNDPDTTLTYRGYIKFLEKDLDNDASPGDSSVSKRQIKKSHEATARNMIARGRAFAIAIAKRFDKSIRLSIHPSTESTKVSIAITPQNDGIIMTPWHSSLVYAVDGSIQLSLSQSEDGNLRDFDNESSTKCDSVSCQQNVSFTHNAGTSSQTLIDMLPARCSRCLTIYEQGNPQAENRLNEEPNPPKDRAAWKALKDWSNMCIMKPCSKMPSGLGRNGARPLWLFPYFRYSPCSDWFDRGSSLMLA
ncbi:predicted protein [Histoplasma mississippiense (nom. inval.)]|nr:predicted protein [Histoplasma mississippiense (nom. inval.)]EDN04080.1 predicted protein [Histoplasma mississippiense (nom. inval.)]